MRIDPWARSTATPAARSTCEGSSEPEAQAQLRSEVEAGNISDAEAWVRRATQIPRVVYRRITTQVDPSSIVVNEPMTREDFMVDFPNGTIVTFVYLRHNERYVVREGPPMTLDSVQSATHGVKPRDALAAFRTDRRIPECPFIRPYQHLEFLDEEQTGSEPSSVAPSDSVARSSAVTVFGALAGTVLLAAAITLVVLKR